LNSKRDFLGDFNREEDITHNEIDSKDVLYNLYNNYDNHPEKEEAFSDKINRDQQSKKDTIKSFLILSKIKKGKLIFLFNY
jgi:hypothetical protein